MLTHKDIWQTIDTMANNNKITPSRMALNCGLDSTTFNKSKRMDAHGKQRWPSSETITKVLNHHNISMTEFGCLCDKCAAERIAREQEQGMKKS